MEPSITRDGTAYSIHGPHDAPFVILIHGLGLTRSIWRWHLPAFVENYRVLHYDLLGHGSSRALQKPDLTQFSCQLKTLMDELLIERASLIGFSLGGMINRRLALDHPDRVHSLMILNSPHERSPEIQRRVESQALESAVHGPGASLDATIDRWFTGDFQIRNPDIIREIRTCLLANETGSYALARQVLAYGVRELIRPDPPIIHPTLIMTAENDQGSTPQMARAIAEEIPGSEVRIVPTGKHMALVESPESFTGPLTAFLERTL